MSKFPNSRGSGSVGKASASSGGGRQSNNSAAAALASGVLSAAAFSKHGANSPRLGPTSRGSGGNYNYAAGTNSPSKRGAGNAGGGGSGIETISLIDDRMDDDDLTDSDDGSFAIIGVSSPTAAKSSGAGAASAGSGGAALSGRQHPPSIMTPSSFLLPLTPPPGVPIGALSGSTIPQSLQAQQAAAAASASQMAAAQRTPPAYLQERKASVRKARYEEEAQEMILAEEDDDEELTEEELTEEEEDEDLTEEEEEEEERAPPSRKSGPKGKPNPGARPQRKGPAKRSAAPSAAVGSSHGLTVSGSGESGSSTRSSSIEYQPKVTQGQIKKMRRDQRMQQRASTQSQGAQMQSGPGIQSASSTAKPLTSASARTKSTAAAPAGDPEFGFADFFTDGTNGESIFGTSAFGSEDDGDSDATEESDDDERALRRSFASNRSVSTGLEEDEGRVELNEEDVQAFLAAALNPTSSDRADTPDFSSDADEDTEEEESDAAYGRRRDFLSNGAAVEPGLAEASQLRPQEQGAYFTQAHAYGIEIPLLVIEETDGRLIRARATGNDAVFGSDGEFEYIGGDDSGPDSDESSYGGDSDDDDDGDVGMLGMSGADAKTGSELDGEEGDAPDSDDDAYMDSAGNPLFMDAELAEKVGLLDDSDHEDGGGAGDGESSQPKQLQKQRAFAQLHRMTPNPNPGRYRQPMQPQKQKRFEQRRKSRASDDGDTTDDLGEYDMPFPRLLVGSMAPRGGRAARRARELAKESRNRNRKAAKAAQQMQRNFFTTPVLGSSAPTFSPAQFVGGGFPFAWQGASPSSLVSTPTLPSNMSFRESPATFSPASLASPPPARASGSAQTPGADSANASFATPRMGTFTSSAKSRRRAFIDGCGPVPSPFTRPPKSSPRTHRSQQSSKKGSREKHKQVSLQWAAMAFAQKDWPARCSQTTTPPRISTPRSCARTRARRP